MPHAKLLASDRAYLVGILRSPSEDHGIARRANAILLLDDGLSYEQVAQVLYLSEGTIREWHKRYREGGFDHLSTFDWQGGQSRLSADQERSVIIYVAQHVFGSTVPIRSYIKQEFSISYSHSGCLKLLHRLGFAYKKPKAVSSQADEAAQEQFINEYNVLANNLAYDEAIYFADAVHPEHQSRPAHGWFLASENVAIKSNSSRQRLNIHGGINLETGQFHMVDALTINAVSTKQLLTKIEADNPKKNRIYVFLDNARYHHARVLKAWLKSPDRKVILKFLPPYAPHLNPIEPLWGLMHKHVTHNRHYDKFADFTEAILGFFCRTLPQNWRKLRDSLSDNFRVISHSGLRIL